MADTPYMGGTFQVGAIDLAKQQITIVSKNHPPQVYLIDDYTTITLRNQKGGKLKDIKVGDEVRSWTERDYSTLDSIDIW